MSDTPPTTPPGINPQDVIDMPINRVLCPLHGEPFRSTWPKGFIIFALEGLDRLLHDSEIAIRCGGDPKRVIEILDARPVCCAVTKDDLMELYRKSEIGVQGRCVHCKNHNLGTPFKTKNAAGETSHKHMCFWCVVHNMRKG